MISYHLCINGSSHAYSLHWWRFNLHRPLSHVRRSLSVVWCTLCLPQQVCSFKLFQGELIHLDLHLLVCQSPDEQYTIVIGCRLVVVTDSAH